MNVEMIILWIIELTILSIFKLLEIHLFPFTFFDTTTKNFRLKCGQHYISVGQEANERKEVAKNCMCSF